MGKQRFEAPVQQVAANNIYNTNHYAAPRPSPRTLVDLDRAELLARREQAYEAWRATRRLRLFTWEGGMYLISFALAACLLPSLLQRLASFSPVGALHMIGGAVAATLFVISTWVGSDRDRRLRVEGAEWVKQIEAIDDALRWRAD